MKLSIAFSLLSIGLSMGCSITRRYRFSIGARRFVIEWNSHGPAHHCAVGVGHVSERIGKLAKLLGIEVIRVC